MANTHAENFALALADASQRGDQTRIAEQLGVSTSLVNSWFKGHAEPNPRHAIAVEAALGVEPGTLTIHLGFLPPDARDVSILSIEEAVIADASLDGRDKRFVLEMVSRLRSQQQ